MRYTRAEIDLDALDHNFHVCRRIAGGRSIFAVVKANGYGHGMVTVARRLEQSSDVTLAVAFLEEAIELREAGIRGQILLMFGAEGRNYEAVLDHSLIPVLWSRKEATALAAVARSKGVRAPVHVKVDTGMGRMGVPWLRAVDEYAAIAAMDALSVKGIMSHLAKADENDTAFTRAQIGHLGEFLTGLRRRGIEPPPVHLANSAGVLGFPASHFDGIRPGIMLYGYDPRTALADGTRTDLKPVMRWLSRIAYIKKVPAGTPLSYGGTFVTDRESLIATVPVGYGDGYSRRLSNTGRVLVGNTSAPVVGRVCMDLTLVDVTAVPGVSEGDEVVLMGPDAGAPDAWDIARTLGSIPYEVLTNVGPRVPRVLKGAAA